MMGAIMGAHVVAATPSGKWAPDTKVVETAKKIAQANGGAVEVTHDPIAAAKDAAVCIPMFGCLWAIPK